VPHFLVTGASQGIGAAVARAFAAVPDAHISLLARRQDALESVADDCRTLGANASVHPCDVTDEAAIGRVSHEIIGRFGAPDVLVNNAGSFQPGDLANTTAEAFRAQIDINLTSAFLVTRAFLPSMLEAGRGTVFFLASVASIRAYPGGLAYCAAKHGFLGLARGVRDETRERGLRVTAILPGATRTPSWDGADIPASRFMPAEDVARAIIDVYYLSDRTVVEELLLRPQLGDL